jgi:predicted  nucleic acid-binding Zn-ribbon protein
VTDDPVGKIVPTETAWRAPAHPILLHHVRGNVVTTPTTVTRRDKTKALPLYTLYSHIAVPSLSHCIMSHPTFGVNETLRKYYLAEQSKTISKRRKLRDATSEQTLEHFVYLNATCALSSSTLRRSQAIKLSSPETKKVTKESEAVNRPAAAETLTPKAPSTREAPNNGDEKGKTETANFKQTHLDLAQQDNDHLEEEEKQLVVDMAKIESARQRVYKDQVELWGVYKYGLQHVMALTDLSAAPDAILPGNFP